jgi:hypothetical protein
MEAEYAIKLLVAAYQTTLCHIPQDRENTIIKLHRFSKSCFITYEYYPLSEKEIRGGLISLWLYKENNKLRD